MPFTNFKAEDDEDSPIPPAERAAAASRSTWMSVGERGAFDDADCGGCVVEIAGVDCRR